LFGIQAFDIEIFRLNSKESEEKKTTEAKKLPFSEYLVKTTAT
jgi:hypothetical protein